MRKRKLYWTLQVIGWSLYALVNITVIFFNPQGLPSREIRLQSLQFFIQVPVLFLYSHFLLRSVIIKRGWIKKGIGAIIIRVSGMVLIMAVLATATVHLFYAGIGAFRSNNEFITQVIFDLLAFTILFIIWSILYFLYHYLESYNQSLKYQAAMNEMLLNQLKSQLNPHFIFNALNSMRALVDENPSKAKNAITQLSNILRNSLIIDKKRVIKFSDELGTVKDYLALEGIRFEERLKVSFDIDPEAGKYEVPPMMLQTLVENAIKHGISNLVQGGEVHLIAGVEDTKLKVTIRNSGQLVNGKRRPNKGGYGLSNTKQRLQLIFGEEASFRIFNESDKFVVTEIKIPQQT